MKMLFAFILCVVPLFSVYGDQPRKIHSELWAALHSGNMPVAHQLIIRSPNLDRDEWLTMMLMEAYGNYKASQIEECLGVLKKIDTYLEWHYDLERSDDSSVD